jgi:hypothetical protein
MQRYCFMQPVSCKQASPEDLASSSPQHGLEFKHHWEILLASALMFVVPGCMGPDRQSLSIRGYVLDLQGMSSLAMHNRDSFCTSVCALCRCCPRLCLLTPMLWRRWSTHPSSSLCGHAQAAAASQRVSLRRQARLCLQQWPDQTTAQQCGYAGLTEACNQQQPVGACVARCGLL